MYEMKTVFAKAAIYIMKGLLNVIYGLMKLFPVNNRKVIFCSRQSDEVPLDFIMIQKYLERKDIQYVNVCCRVGNGIGQYIHFLKATLQSMYHLATGKVCILDSYWPAVSLLKHKSQLKVIQIWHAIGKIKQSGYQTLDKKSGRKKEYALLLGMHRNYEYVIAGAPFWNKYYCEAFNITEDKILNFGLPRIDYLINTEKRNKERFFGENPDLERKRIILYAPTFRKNMKSNWEDIIDEVKDDGYVLIIKKHPGEKSKIQAHVPNVYYFDNWRTLDLIAVCDFFITDYSAMALEAAVLDKKTYYWTYDYDKYVKNNGLNLDMKKEIGEYVFDDIKALMAELKTGGYEEKFMKSYREKYLPEDLGKSTEKIGCLIMELLKQGR